MADFVVEVVAEAVKEDSEKEELDSKVEEAEAVEVVEDLEDLKGVKMHRLDLIQDSKVLNMLLINSRMFCIIRLKRSSLHT